MSESASLLMTPAQCKSMRIPDLGVAILRRLAVLGEQWRNDHNFVQWTVEGNDGWLPSNRVVTTSIYIPGDDRAERGALKASYDKRGRGWSRRAMWSPITTSATATSG